MGERYVFSTPLLLAGADLVTVPYGRRGRVIAWLAANSAVAHRITPTDNFTPDPSQLVTSPTAQVIDLGAFNTDVVGNTVLGSQQLGDKGIGFIGTLNVAGDSDDPDCQVSALVEFF